MFLSISLTMKCVYATFFGILVMMNNLVEKPLYEDYFERNEQIQLFHTPGFGKIVSKKHFNQIKCYIYFSSCKNDEKLDGPFKIRPFLEHLDRNVFKEYQCSRELSLDEGVVPCKGCLDIKQIASKQVSRGIKLWMLTDSNNSYRSDRYLSLPWKRQQSQ